MNKKRLIESIMTKVIPLIENALTEDEIDDEIVEIRSDYYDEEKHATSIDVWISDDDDDEGISVALVYDNGEVFWKDMRFRKSQRVKDEIEYVIENR